MCALSVCTMYMCARVCVHAVHVYVTCVLCMCACARVCACMCIVYTCVCYHLFFAQSPISAHSGRSRVLAVGNDAAGNMGCGDLATVFFFGKILRSGLLTDAGILVVSEEPPYCSPQRLHQLTPPPAAHEPPFPHVLAHTYASSF